jgi:hypothetical protein
MSPAGHPLEVLLEAWQARNAGELMVWGAVRASMTAAEDQVEAFSRDAGDPYWTDYFGAVTRGFGKVVDRLEGGDGECRACGGRHSPGGLVEAGPNAVAFTLCR